MKIDQSFSDIEPSTNYYLFVRAERVSKSYIVNSMHINSLDNNTIYMKENEIPIGNIYRDYFFKEFVTKKMLGNNTS
ncbi:hypothetical protein ACNFU2_05725 [Chryseobacterium sp. PTM-20240506]|uniref:hypothetical protein n=1 Tax=Chryseobacterium sp. PTM-20240506 TaxID=3400631 RepID=UPI0027A6BC12|nr:hypothetical protein PFY10_05445 [Chryseobacterium daecheongense]